VPPTMEVAQQKNESERSVCVQHWALISEGDSKDIIHVVSIEIIVLRESGRFCGICRFRKKKKTRQIRVRAGAGPAGGAGRRGVGPAPPPRAPEFGVFFVFFFAPRILKARIMHVKSSSRLGKTKGLTAELRHTSAACAAAKCFSTRCWKLL